MKPIPKTIQKLGNELAQDELFDLTLYRILRNEVDDELRAKLDKLIPLEEKQLAFWKDFFDINVERLDFIRRVKLRLILFFSRLFGSGFIYLLMESIEIHGVKKYLRLWDSYKDTQLSGVIYKILDEEFRVEDEIIFAEDSQRRINGEKIRNIFLGLNDGLVETLGAISGFIAAFQDNERVFIAGLTVAVAGAFSMAAGVFVSSGSQKEMELVQRRKMEFLGKFDRHQSLGGVKPISQLFIVGLAYLGGAGVPLLPIFLGAETVFAPLLAAAFIIVIISFILAFLSGMNIRRRVLLNLTIVMAAVAVTYTLGLVIRNIWGLQV